MGIRIESRMTAGEYVVKKKKIENNNNAQSTLALCVYFAGFEYIYIYSKINTFGETKNKINNLHLTYLK
jgi:hypothetical protein